MERNHTVAEILKSCPFLHPETGMPVFGYKMMRDMVCIWQYMPEIVFGKGLIEAPEGFEDRYTIGVGVVLAAGTGHYTDKGKWIPVNSYIAPGAVVEYDKTIPWEFPVKVEDVDGTLHSLPMCPSVNIFGVYPEE